MTTCKILLLLPKKFPVNLYCTNFLQNHLVARNKQKHSKIHWKTLNMLIKFKCKNKEYRYACLVLSAENNEIQVQGLRSSNKEKTQFVIKENDTFTISQDDIAERLPQPNILWKKRVITYDFPESLDVFEK
uniref:Uncharacterized protein n=1 Tax=Cacopsylla melanoneura TaxID=428564 RepID=A0A8D8RCE7_9HEMI